MKTDTEEPLISNSHASDQKAIGFIQAIFLPGVIMVC